MKVPVRCVATKGGGVRIETPAHVSRGSGAPMWVSVIEIPPEQHESFLRGYLAVTPHDSDGARHPDLVDL